MPTSRILRRQLRLRQAAAGGGACRGDAGRRFRSGQRPALRPLLLRRLGGRHAGSGRADRQLAEALTCQTAPLIASCVAIRFCGDGSSSCRGGASPKPALRPARWCWWPAAGLISTGAMPGGVHVAATAPAHQRTRLLHRDPDYDAAIDRHDDPWTDDLLRCRSGSAGFSPGQGWSYSNTGYFLVRRLIEQATGHDIERALQALVLGRSA